ncbi:nucleotidyl transferase AbiEii/AbiGii toxin family protein [Candidatus Kuenenbacteria bacterium]|nr:nucleotidyl transferase AbiEii/AbiGii toxin family protein [Candidatus Kuenenbacteria bacterium]
MHKEILTKEQIELLSLVKKFIKDFGLVGGTAIALQIGHRQSIDFDLFSNKEFNNIKIKQIIKRSGYKINKTFKDEIGQFTFFVNNAQFTFFHYPFKINYTVCFDKISKMPSLLTLAAMKAYALGMRAKWKDYVDLYFIINKYHSIEKIVKRSKAIFRGEFNERIFREQLTYFEDISYKEKIVWMKGFETDEKTIKKELINFSLT